ncbi:fp/25k [Sucra jujuba nucleopolyhedrovirus]|uniref:Fp/25k n=1 Tax=Sucra jujuba nucleopolyhedrovirus TaxID=1563660 RepID=A0A097P8Y1_9ABAC|nr:fp/25k [Sucra jujuba nucleopolyhedrovirus]AIU41287.1 fp/25k [Sucra jujuba nucleopolyhedrovirus]
MVMNGDLINVSILKNLIKHEIDRNVTENLNELESKLQKLENAELNNCVEVYGIHDNRLNDKKVRNQYVKKICVLLNLDYKHIVDSEFRKNYIKLKLIDAATAREWQMQSCKLRIKNYDLGIEYDAPVKIFVAASQEHKQLLKKTRDSLLQYYKYVSLCKNGVMVRKNDTSKIYMVKNESDIYNLLVRAKTVQHEDSIQKSNQQLDSDDTEQRLI